MEISPEVTSGTLRSVFLVTGGNSQRFPTVPNEPGDDRFGMMTERKEREGAKCELGLAAAGVRLPSSLLES